MQCSKKLEFQLALWTSSSHKTNYLFPWGHCLLEIASDLYPRLMYLHEQDYFSGQCKTQTMDCCFYHGNENVTTIVPLFSNPKNNSRQSVHSLHFTLPHHLSICYEESSIFFLVMQRRLSITTSRRFISVYLFSPNSYHTQI